MRLLPLVLLLAACSPAPGSIDPGDQGAIGWVPSERVVGPVIDCHGGSRGSLQIRESGTTLRNCTIRGNVRVWGAGRNGSSQLLYDSSREADHVSATRAAGPSWVTIEDTTIIGTTGTIPLYLGPGVTMATLRRVRLEGHSVSVMMYLDAESHGTTTEDVEIDATDAGREAVAVDGSDGNDLSGLTIRHSGKGGIYLYRNCGESGVARHTTPSDNVIDATILGGGIAVYLGAREGRRSYCGEDRDGRYGSSVSNYDHARRNVVTIRSDGEIKQGSTARDNVTSRENP
jgi:hypothetical protein